MKTPFCSGKKTAFQNLKSVQIRVNQFFRYVLNDCTPLVACTPIAGCTSYFATYNRRTPQNVHKQVLCDGVNRNECVGLCLRNTLCVFSRFEYLQHLPEPHWEQKLLFRPELLLHIRLLLLHQGLLRVRIRFCLSSFFPFGKNTTLKRDC